MRLTLPVITISQKKIFYMLVFPHRRCCVCRGGMCGAYQPVRLGHPHLNGSGRAGGRATRGDILSGGDMEEAGISLKQNFIPLVTTPGRDDSRRTKSQKTKTKPVTPGRRNSPERLLTGMEWGNVNGIVRY